ncbi:hypothetical protein F5148DRAFT_1282233 [Russula earlei]|uniref:Uncharacterized protein n=1 Tax=Russula earlei TaxID=71964 RepID=A0ACC0UF63_9AGAM|nr:hypothetical protein F5148DRAFT_1282233 [Russula earlei]
MDPHNNLDLSPFHQYDPDAPMPQHDIHQEYQIPQATGSYNTFQQPPGAETETPLPPTQPYQPKHSLQDSMSRLGGYPGIGGHPTQTLMPFPIGNQSDESTNTFYGPTPSRSISLSPSHVYHIRPSVPEFRHPSTSQPTPHTLSNPPRGHSSRKFRATSPPSPTPTQALRDRSSLPRVDHYTSATHIAFPPSKLPTANTMQLGVSFPAPAPSGAPRRHHSETDMPNAQNALQSLYNLGHPPASTMYSPFSEQSGFSAEPSGSQRIAPWFMDTMPDPSCHSHALPVRNTDDSFPSTASDSPDGSVSSMYSGLSSAVAHGAPSHAADPKRPPTTSSDPRATNRLLDQRKSDDENIEALCKLFVPEGAEVKWKKDRLGMIVHYATQLVERYKHLLEYYERNTGARKEHLVESDEGLTESQGQLLTSHGDVSNLMGHWVTTNNNMDSTLGSVQPWLRHQPRSSPIDERHDASRPM